MIRPLHTLLAVVGLVLIGLIWITLTWPSSGPTLDAPPTRNAELLSLTPTGARVRGENYLRNAVAYSQTTYAAAQWKDRPAAVILVRDDDQATAIAATRLQHFPVNAPMLFLTNGGTVLPPETRTEMLRLGPEGVMMDNNVRAYLVGDIAPSVAAEVERIGFKTRCIRAENPLALTEALDEFIAVLESDHIGFVLVGAADALDFALPAANWNAHMGGGFAYVTAEGVPPETRRMLERRGPNYAYIYVFAPPDIVPQEVLAELTRYGHVRRIPGETPQEMAAEWADYAETGRLLGWWFGERARSVGWDIGVGGHNTILANPADWRQVVSSGVLSHMGKHAALLLTNIDGTLPDAAVRFLRVIKPEPTHPSQQYFNFGWAIGSGIPDSTLSEYAELLSIAE